MESSIFSDQFGTTRMKQSGHHEVKRLVWLIPQLLFPGFKSASRRWFTASSRSSLEELSPALYEVRLVPLI
jgi:hypothetical protein